MKIPFSIQIKDTTRLFLGKYKNKVVLLTPLAYYLRDLKIDLAKIRTSELEPGPKTKIKSKDQAVYFGRVCDILKKYSNDFSLRVESPRLNIYTNNSELIEKLCKLDEQQVKFVAFPNENYPELIAGSVIVKRLDFGFKVHLGPTKTENIAFIKWTENNPKIKMPKRCSADLSRSKSWGGSYFYVKDEKTLTMVRMFLGSNISKVETVVKA